MILFSGLFVVFRGNASGNFATAAYHATLAAQVDHRRALFSRDHAFAHRGFPLSVYLFKCFFLLLPAVFLPLPPLFFAFFNRRRATCYANETLADLRIGV